MSHGARLSNVVKQLISQEAKEQRSKDRRLLAIELQDKFRKMNEPIPEEETIIKLISKYRNEPLEQIDKPWTLAASNYYNFPPESTPILLRVWKLCIATGFPFTIREAKWVIYLSPMIPNIRELTKWAKRYATNERLSKLINDELESSDLDAVLNMNMLEYITQSFIGMTAYRQIPGGVPMVRPSSSLYFGDDSLEAAKLIEQKAMNPYVTFLNDDIVKAGSPFIDFSLSTEVIWIYVFWLSLIVNNPKWKTLDRDRAIETINNLRKWASKFESLLPTICEKLSEYIKREVEEPIGLMKVFLNVEGSIPNDVLLQFYGTDTPPNQYLYWDKLSKRLERKNVKFKTFMTHHPNFDFNNISLEEK
jgi:hypothetical protein